MTCNSEKSKSDKNLVFTEDVKKDPENIYYNMEYDEEESHKPDKTTKMDVDDEIIKNNDRHAPMTRTYL